MAARRYDGPAATARTASAATYVLVVMVVAAMGFRTESTELILLAAALGLPGSLLAVPGYYLAYGLLALVPGANPSSSSGSMTCSPDGVCHGSITGEPAAWFLITTDALGILALGGAAVLNVVALGLLNRFHRRRKAVANAAEA